MVDSHLRQTARRRKLQSATMKSFLSTLTFTSSLSFLYNITLSPTLIYNDENTNTPIREKPTDISLNLVCFANYIIQPYLPVVVFVIYKVTIANI